MNKRTRKEDPRIDFLNRVCRIPGLRVLNYTAKRAARDGQVAVSPSTRQAGTAVIHLRTCWACEGSYQTSQAFWNM